MSLCAAAFAQDCTGELGADTSTDLSSVPESVLSAARERAGVELTNVNTENASGRTVYEISGIGDDGCRVEVDIFESGEVEEVERETSVGEVPEAVSATLERYLPGFSAEVVEKSERSEATFFEMTGTAY